MSEALFRVGGVYRQQDGDVVRIDKTWVDGDIGGVLLTGRFTGARSAGYNPNNGRYVFAMRAENHDTHLLPGELTNIDGQWVSMTPTLDKLKAEKAIAGPDATLEQVMDAIADMHIADAANAQMSARDDTDAARMYATERYVKEILAARARHSLSTAKAPIPGLTRMSAQDHRLGLGRSFG